MKKTQLPKFAKLLCLSALFLLKPLWSFGNYVYEPKYGFPNNNYISSVSPYFIVELEFSEYGCEYQVSSDASFTKIVKDTFADSSTLGHLYIESLQFNTHYYWRARAVYRKDTSVWSLTWSFVTINQPVLVSPQNNYPGGDTLAVFCAGTPDYVFQMDADSSFKTSALQSVHITKADLTANTNKAGMVTRFGNTYYWRVKAIQGKDSSLWSYAWRFYTTNDTLVSPDNNIVGISDSVNLVWSNYVHPDYFELQWDTSASFNTPFKKDSMIAGENGGKKIPLMNLHYNKKYFWRIRDVKPGDTSAWSKPRAYTTYKAPYFGSPSNNSTQSYLTGDFTWRNTGFSHRYIIEFDTAATFNSPALVNKTVIGEKTNIPWQYGKTYYWRVKTFNAADTSQWSDVYNFFTAARQKTLIGPTNGLTNQPVQIQVFALSNHALYTVIEYDTSASFNTVFYKSDTVRFASAGVIFYDSLKQLRFNTKYYYRAKDYYAKDSDDASTPFWFSTVAVPVPNFPSNGQLNIGLETYVVATPIIGASGYIWQLDTSATFASPVSEQGYSDSATGEPGTDFYFNKWYYYRFKAISGNDTSAWSVAWRFQSTDTMFLYTPINLATGVSAKPNLEWGGVIGARGYQYMINTDKALAGAKIVTVQDGDSNLVQVNLVLGETYYWKVRAYDAKDTGKWSLIWTFTTKPAPLLNAPLLQSPANNSSNIPLPANRLSFFWNANGTSADSFFFQLSFDNTFATTLLSGPVHFTYAVVDNMEGHKTYYWRVKTYSGSAESPWSSVFRFTTGADAGIGDNINGQSNIKIYPDPATSFFTIKLPENGGLIRASLLDFSGKLVRSVSGLEMNTLTMPITGLAAGIYLVKVESAEGVYYQKVVVR